MSVLPAIINIYRYQDPPVSMGGSVAFFRLWWLDVQRLMFCPAFGTRQLRNLFPIRAVRTEIVHCCMD